MVLPLHFLGLIVFIIFHKCTDNVGKLEITGPTNVVCLGTKSASAHDISLYTG